MLPEDVAADAEYRARINLEAAVKAMPSRTATGCSATEIASPTA
jgi:hypothetical protein